MIARSSYTVGSSSAQPGHGDILEIALGGLFREESILTRSLRSLAGGVVEVSFIFPDYERTVDDLGHVSANQINEAIVEGMNCSIAQAIAEGRFPLPVDLQWYRAHWSDWIVSRQFVEYRKMIQPAQVARLQFSILGVELKSFKREFYRLTMGLNGFLRGEVDWLIESTHIS